MQFSTVQLQNAIGWYGTTPSISNARPIPGLVSVHNRMDWLSWGKVEVSRDVYDWTLADAYVTANIAQGLSPIGCLHGAPAWWRDESDKAQYDAWWLYCKMLADRYLGRVTVWEIGNEFDTIGFWLFGEAAKMGRYWRIAHDVFLSVDPTCTVICGSVQSLGPTGRGLSDISTALKSFDGVVHALAIHIYTDAHSISSIKDLVNQARGVLIANGSSSADIWVTEVGSATFGAMSSRQQLDWLTSVRAELEAAGVFATLHWVFDDNTFGFRDFQVGKTIWNLAAS